jgi:hypothetical protein
MTIPAQQGGAVTFRVYGYDSTGNNANQLFNKTFAPDATASVTAQPINGIALDVGDINVGRLSGTITFTSMHSPAPNELLLQAYAYYPKSGSYDNRTTMENMSYHAIAMNGTAGTWTIPRDDKFLAELEKENQNVTFYVAVRLNQGEGSFDVTQFSVEIDKNNLSNINLGNIAIPQYIKLSGTFTGSYNGSSLSQVSIYARDEASGNQLGNSVYIESPTASNFSWSLYMPVSSSPIKVVFNVASRTNNTMLFNITVPNPQTASVSNQDISGIAIDVGNIVPNTLRVNNPPSGSYTAYVTAISVSQTNYPSISQSGNHVASGTGTGSSISLDWQSGTDQNRNYYMLITSGAITKLNMVQFINGIGAVDWNTMTEAVGSKLTITGNPPSGELVAYVSSAQITNMNYTTVLDTYRSTGSGSASPITLMWGTNYGNGTHHVLIKTSGDEYWYKNSISFSDGAGTVDWGDMTKVTSELPPPSDFYVSDTKLDSVTLSWQSVPSASSYKVYRSDTPLGTYALIGSPSVSSYTDSGLSSGITHYYKVSTVASDGTEGPLTDYDDGTTYGGPVAPTGLSATSSTSNSITLSWTNIIGVASYKIYRSNNPSGPFASIGSPVSSPYTDSDLNPGTYYYKITAVSSYDYEGSQSGAVSGATTGSSDPEPGNSDTLTISGYSGVSTVFVTQTTITQENYSSIMSSGFAATGTAISGSVADLIWQNGFSKSGNYNILLATTDGYRYQNSVSFSDGSATVNYGGMTEIEIGGGGEVKTGSLTINGLPSGDTFAVYVFAPGTDISTVNAVLAALASYQAAGFTATSGVFTIVGMNGSEPVDFEASGNFPVLLLNSAGAMIDSGGSAPMYSWASVNFSDGTATVSYSSFTGMFMTF